MEQARNKIRLTVFTAEGEAKESSALLLKKAVEAFCSLQGVETKKVVKDERGKPYFEDFSPFHLSLTHTGRRFAVAFAPFPIGLDGEESKTKNIRVALRYFSPEERKQPFARIWCGREAVGKLTGGGLSHALAARIKGDIATLHGERFRLFYEEREDVVYCMAVREMKE